MFSNSNKIKLFITLFFAMNLFCYSAPATLNFSVDNLVTKVTVNGNSVSLSGISAADLDNWKVTKTLALSIKGGDTLEICGSNDGVYNPGNPAGIIATLNYINIIGASATLSTDSTWKCGCGGTALEGQNNDNTTKWYIGKPGPMTGGISPTAWWIWNQTLSTPAQCCSVKVPYYVCSTGCGHGCRHGCGHGCGHGCVGGSLP